MIDDTEYSFATTASELEKFVSDNKIPLRSLQQSISPVPTQNGSYSVYINTDNQTEEREEETSTVLFHSKIKKWVSDDLVESCHNCKKQFSMLVRKHHCRSCGHIYCYECANNFAHFPKNLLTLEEPNALPKLASFSSETPAPTPAPTPSQTPVPNQPSTPLAQRTCTKCFNKIRLMRIVWSKIELIRNSSLTILDIQIIKSTTTCSQWREASLYFIAQFRSLLYQFTKDKPTSEEISLIKKNVHLIKNHSCWLVTYLKSTSWEDLSILQQQSIINSLNASSHPLNIPCSKLYCTSRCKPNLTMEDIVELLSEVHSNLAREYLITQLPTSQTITENQEQEMLCYLPLLTKLLDKDWNNNLADYLISICSRSEILRYDFLRYLRFISSTTNPQLQQILNRYQRKILSISPQIMSHIINTEHFIKLIDSTPTLTTTTDITNIKNHFASSTIFQNIETADNPSEPKWTTITTKPKKNYHLPTDPSHFIKRIDADNITIKNSATQPILIPCECYKDIPTKNKKYKKHHKTVYPTKHILFKREDMTKDLIIMNIISLMDIFLKRDENIDFNITKYKILPTSQNAGIIEIVSGAETFYNIKEKHNYTIQNFMIEKNKESTTQDLRRRFATSTAAYCVITYLLGIGDRHLDNIMIANNGSLFHIDYSFILGSDPKMLEPHMRITEDMIDALGGAESADYKYFKELCFKAYNCLRKHYNIFTQLLLLLPNVRHEHIKKEIFKRFIPCEKDITADLQLEKSLETHSRSYKYNLIDFIYRHKKEQTLQSGLLDLIKSPYYLYKRYASA